MEKMAHVGAEKERERNRGREREEERERPSEADGGSLWPSEGGGSRRGSICSMGLPQRARKRERGETTGDGSTGWRGGGRRFLGGRRGHRAAKAARAESWKRRASAFFKGEEEQ